MRTVFKHCSFFFVYKISPQTVYIQITRHDGQPTLKVNYDDFSSLLNALIASHTIINSPETVSSYCLNINPEFDKETETELYLLTTKIGSEIRTSILGFEHHASTTPTKRHSVYIDQEDDIFQLCSNFLRFMSEFGDYRTKISIL